MTVDYLHLAIDGLVTQLPAELVGAAVVATVSAVVARWRRRRNRDDE